MYCKTVEIRNGKLYYSGDNKERVDRETNPVSVTAYMGYFHYDRAIHTKETAFNELKKQMIASNTEAINKLHQANKLLNNLMLE